MDLGKRGGGGQGLGGREGGETGWDIIDERRINKLIKKSKGKKGNMIRPKKKICLGMKNHGDFSIHLKKQI